MWTRRSVNSFTFGVVGGFDVLLLKCVSFGLGWLVRTFLCPAYFNRTCRSSIKAPIVVEVEADQSQDANVEQNLPSGDQTTIAIDPVTPILGVGAGSSRLGWEKNRNSIGELVAVAELVGEKNCDVEDPRRSWDISWRNCGSHLVVDVQDSQHFQGRNAV